ncbi:hypothetical protein ACGFZQ_20360 [Streptomyces sp. NPDC048254]|uniref:hypothetical protein n=1 Tax=Streptomyces sp. NPDC048254 TaxID=3365525 RepID=UPI00371EC164
MKSDVVRWCPMPLDAVGLRPIAPDRGRSRHIAPDRRRSRHIAPDRRRSRHIASGGIPTAIRRHFNGIRGHSAASDGILGRRPMNRMAETEDLLSATSAK